MQPLGNQEGMRYSLINGLCGHSFHAANRKKRNGVGAHNWRGINLAQDNAIWKMGVAEAQSQSYLVWASVSFPGQPWASCGEGPPLRPWSCLLYSVRPKQLFQIRHEPVGILLSWRWYRRWGLMTTGHIILPLIHVLFPVHLCSLKFCCCPKSCCIPNISQTLAKCNKTWEGQEKQPRKMSTCRQVPCHNSSPVDQTRSREAFKKGGWKLEPWSDPDSKQVHMLCALGLNMCFSIPHFPHQWDGGSSTPLTGLQKETNGNRHEPRMSYVLTNMTWKCAHPASTNAHWYCHWLMRCGSPRLTELILRKWGWSWDKVFLNSIAIY
jgi:hypothetical protein